MPFYSREDVEKRKAAGVKMNKLNCGWNLPTEITATIVTRIAGLKPTTEAARRNKHILELAFVHDMNPQQIARLNDPLLVGMGNRNSGKPISSKYIYDVCMKFAPEVAAYRKEHRTQRAGQKQRNALYRSRQTGEIKKSNVCATCGSKNEVELHHIIPLAAGGTNDYYNLISLCHNCHMNLHHKIYDSIQWKSANSKKDNIE